MLVALTFSQYGLSLVKLHAPKTAVSKLMKIVAASWKLSCLHPKWVESSGVMLPGASLITISLCVLLNEASAAPILAPVVDPGGKCVESKMIGKACTVLGLAVNTNVRPEEMSSGALATVPAGGFGIVSGLVAQVHPEGATQVPVPPVLIMVKVAVTVVVELAERVGVQVVPVPVQPPPDHPETVKPLAGLAVNIGPVLLVRPLTVHVLPQLIPVPVTVPLTGVVTVSAYVGPAVKLAVTVVV